MITGDTLAPEQMEKTMEEQEKTNEEEVVEEKAFDEMTEEEQNNLSDEDLVKNLESEEEKKPETPAGEEEKTGDADTLEGETDEKKEDEELSEEELAKLSPRERGFYHDMRKERDRAQRVENEEIQRLRLESEKNKAAYDATVRTLQHFKERDTPQQELSETDKFWQGIDDKVKEYEEETGDEYRLTASEVRALDRAKSADIESDQKLASEENVKTQRDAQVSREIERLTQSEDTLKSTLGDSNDYDHVYDNYIKPLINPETASDKEKAIRLYTAIVQADNPAEYAYEVIAKLTKEGREYFKKKEEGATTRETNKKILAATKKTIPKTSAHLPNNKSSDGRSKVPSIHDMSQKEHEEWMQRMTDEQMVALCEGEDVYI